MKKLLIAILLMGMASGIGHAQIITLGVTGGLNSSNITAEDVFDLGSGTLAEIKNGTNQLGYHLGLTSRVKILGLFVQPELLFTSINSEMSVKDPSTGMEETEEIKIQRLDLPILIGLKLGPALGFIGPIMSRQMQTEPETSELVFKSGTWGYQIGAGLEFGKFGIDLRYEGSFSSPVTSVVINNQTFELDSRVSQLILSGSYHFW